MVLATDETEFARLLTRLVDFFLPAVRSALAVDGIALPPAKLRMAAEELASGWLACIRCFATTESGELDVTALDDRLLPTRADLEGFYVLYREGRSAMNDECAERALRFARKLLEGSLSAPTGARELIRLIKDQPDIRRN